MGLRPQLPPDDHLLASDSQNQHHHLGPAACGCPRATQRPPIKGKATYVVEIWPTGVAEGRAVITCRCARGAPRGSVGPFSMGSSHCLAQYGCEGGRFLLSCLTTLVMGGAGSGNAGPVIWKLNLLEGLQYLSTSNHGSSILSNMNPLKTPNMVALPYLQ